MKLIFVIPSLQPGGMERVMSQIIDEFSNYHNLELHLILYGRTRTVFYDVPNSIILHKPNFIFNERKRTFHTLKTIYFLRQTFKKIKPDSILSFGEIWNNLVLISLLGLKHNLYISDRCQPDKRFGKLHTYLRKKLYPNSTGIIAQTNLAKKVYKSQFNHDNIKVIANPVAKVNKIEEKGENIILTVGRLIDSKHHDRLIRLFSSIVDKNWKLIIVGGDALKQNNKLKLEKLVKQLNLENQVEMTGNVSDVEKYYKKSKIFAFTSSSEGFPNVLGEALAFGLPVVSYNCTAGPADIISEGYNGFLVKTFDDETFKERLIYLMNNSAAMTELSRNAKKSVKQFDKELIAKKYYQFITEKL